MFSKYFLRSPCIPQRYLRLVFRAMGEERTLNLTTHSPSQKSQQLYFFFISFKSFIKGSELLVEILKRFESQDLVFNRCCKPHPFLLSTYFYAHHLHIFAWRLFCCRSLLATQTMCQANNTSWKQPSTTDWGSGCVSVPAPSPLRWHLSETCGPTCLQGLPWGMKPIEVTSVISHLLLAIPLVPHFPTSVLWAPFPEKLLKLLGLKPLSQGQLLGNPTQCIEQFC